MTVFVDAVCHLGIYSVAGDGNALTTVAVDEVDGKYISIPQIFYIGEFFQIRAEVFQKVISRAGRNAGHGRIGKSRNAVGYLMDRSVSAAGVNPHLFPALRKRAGDFHSAAGALCQHAGAIQPMVVPQIIGHLINAGGLIPFSRIRIYNKYMFHEGIPSRF